ncbi:transposase [Paenibacillus amylolyticus]|uniref:Transposase n=1 Tax=Paenibacillus amylolyticus TaxID=1451 RepID=A0A1R1BDQ2_PAEAM|nr:transposase [Paenibacillus amylolyticus]
MAKKGQTFRRYSLELKLEAARLVNEEHMSIREVAKCLGIQNKSQVQVWAAKTKQGMSLEPVTSKRGRLRTTFSSTEEEMAYLRAEIEYLKKQYPNLHKE